MAETKLKEAENVTPTPLIAIESNEKTHNLFLDRLLSHDEKNLIRRKSSKIKVLIQRQKSFDVPLLDSPIGLKQPNSSVEKKSIHSLEEQKTNQIEETTPSEHDLLSPDVSPSLVLKPSKKTMLSSLKV